MVEPAFPVSYLPHLLFYVFRRFFFGGELGGPLLSKWLTGGLLLGLWMTFATVVTLQAYEVF